MIQQKGFVYVVLFISMISLVSGLTNDYYSVNKNTIEITTNDSIKDLLDIELTSFEQTSMLFTFQFQGEIISYLYFDEQSLVIPNEGSASITLKLHNYPTDGSYSGFLFLVNDKATTNIPIELTISSESVITTTTVPIITSSSTTSSISPQGTSNSATTTTIRPTPTQDGSFYANFTKTYAVKGKTLESIIVNNNVPESLLLEIYIFDKEGKEFVHEQQEILNEHVNKIEINIPKDIDSKDYSVEIFDTKSLKRYSKDINIRDSKSWSTFFLILGVLISLPLLYYGFLYLFSFIYYNKEKIKLGGIMNSLKERRDRNKQRRKKKQEEKLERNRLALQKREEEKKKKIEKKEEAFQLKLDEKEKKKQDNLMNLDKKNQKRMKESSLNDVPIPKGDRDELKKPVKLPDSDKLADLTDKKPLGTFKDFKKHKDDKLEVDKLQDKERELQIKRELEEKSVRFKKEEKKKKIIAEKYIIKQIKRKHRYERIVIKHIQKIQDDAYQLRNNLDSGNINKATINLREMRLRYKKINEMISQFDLHDSKKLMDILDETQDIIDQKRKPANLMKILRINHLIDEKKIRDTKLPSFKKFEYDKKVLGELGIRSIFGKKTNPKEKPKFLSFMKKNTETLLFELENEIDVQRELNQGRYSGHEKEIIMHFQKNLRICNEYIHQKNKTKVHKAYKDLKRDYNRIKDSSLLFDKKMIFFDSVNSVFNSIKKMHK